MASITMTASFLGTTTVSKNLSTNGQRGVVVAKAMRRSESGAHTEQESSTKRRDLVFAATAACSIAKIEIAEEPKRRTAGTKKKYAAICVSLPTASICCK